MMNLTWAVSTATRGVFSKNVVIAYLPSVADGFIVGEVKRHRRVNDDRDNLHEVTSLNRLVGISSIYHRLIIVEDIFLSHNLDARKETRL